jgi:transposase
VITLEDWALIRRLAAEGVPKARIAERLGISRTTVVKAVASDAPPRYERRPVETSFAVFEAEFGRAGRRAGDASDGAR